MAIAPEQAGIGIHRRFTTEGVHPYDEIAWELRDARIANWQDGTVAFEQTGVEFPTGWSVNATNIVAQKYFRGTLGTPEREWSLRQVIDRVADTITTWGAAGGYFLDDAEAAAFNAELKHLLVTQKAAFNSPVWFNIGVEGVPQQASACQPYGALVSTPEGLVPIGRLVEDDAVGAKVHDAHGVTQIVATRANGSKAVLRLHTEAGYTLDVTPDHLVWRASAAGSAGAGGGEFVQAGALRAGDLVCWRRAPSWGAGPIEPTQVSEAAVAGWLHGGGTGGGTVGQHGGGTGGEGLPAFELVTTNDAEHAWVIGHLDIAFPDARREVRSIEPQGRALPERRISVCGEALGPFLQRWGLLARGAGMRAPAQLFAAPLPAVAAYMRSVFQAGGYVSARRGAAVVSLDLTGQDHARDLQSLLLRFGIFSRVRRRDDRGPGGPSAWRLSVGPLGERDRFAAEIGFVDPCKAGLLEASLDLPGVGSSDVRRLRVSRVEELGEQPVYDIQTDSGEYLSGGLRVHNCFILSVEDTMDSILNWYVEEGRIFKGGSGSGVNLSSIRSSVEPLAGGGAASGPVSFMRGADASAGTIKSGGKTRRAAKMVILNADHPDIEEFIWVKAREERKIRALAEAGFDMSLDGKDMASVQYQNANNSVRVTDEFMQAVVEDADWRLRAVTTGEVVKTIRARDLMRQISSAAWECADPGMQFDTTINRWNTAANSGRINGSNPCSEYMHLDNSACNLASLNLLAFLAPPQDGAVDRFDIEGFRHAVGVVFTAQEILVGRADYPTEAIAQTSRRFRQLGIGYANLGALLMALGLPYDSDEGRSYAAAITSLMTGHAYATSARIAARMGPFAGYAQNREHMLAVLAQHRAAAAVVDEELVPAELMSAAQQCWDEACELAERFGVRNSQASVLAPTGCLVGGALIPTDRGLVRLRSLGEPEGVRWQDLHISVLTDDGERRATRFFVNGLERVLDVRTERGYRIQGTAGHRVKVVDAAGEWVWRRFADLRPGDNVPLALGQMMGEPRRVALAPPGEGSAWLAECDGRAPEEMTAELAELVGYFMGEGALRADGVHLRVADGGFEVVERLGQLAKSLFGIQPTTLAAPGAVTLRIGSGGLAGWWQAAGLARRPPGDGSGGPGGAPWVPDAVLQTNDAETYRAFLRGLFEAAGAGRPCMASASGEFAQEVQSLLLALGFATQRRGASASAGGSRPHVVSLLDQATTQRWLEEIGFLSGRKASEVVLGERPRSSPDDRIPVSRGLIERVAPVGGRYRRAALAEHARSGTISRALARRLHDASGDGELARLLGFFFDAVASAELGEEELTYDISVPDNVTYVANGFVSHNTIGLMMDCDTTGIEPDLGLCKVKKLVGGGTMQIVNQTVPRALRRLGYSEAQTAEIVAYIDEHKSILGAPHLAAEHVAVFACSMGDNPIHYSGHVRMMAAVQPFISGAISKTVNMPEEATVEEVEQLHVDAWRMGVKAIAIYRDNCKVAQPLSTAKREPAAPQALDAAPTEAVERVVERIVKVPVREKLPRNRASRTFEFRVADCKGYVTVGEYADGRPGEIFLKVSKQGSTLAGIMDAFAISVSHGLQYGVPLRSFVEAFTNTRFEPMGMTDDPELRIATSILDYIFRRLAVDYLSYHERGELNILTTGERTQPTLPGVEETVTETRQGGDVPADPPSLDSSSPLLQDARGAPREPSLLERAGVTEPPAPVRASPVLQPPAPTRDAPICMTCGVQMLRSGSCHACPSCGSTSGCS